MIMAKKKQKKQKDGAKFEYSNEVVGVLLILFWNWGIWPSWEFY